MPVLAYPSLVAYYSGMTALGLGENPAVLNVNTFKMFGVFLFGFAITGCSHTTENANLPVGDAAYAVIPAQPDIPAAYSIRPQDILSVKVLGEPELTIDTLTVSAVGDIEYPLLGTIVVGGRSVADVAKEISDRLRAHYLVNPEVTVWVKKPAPLFASVEGEVNMPGVYEINANATLLSIIARAQSPTRTAKLNEIIVFRTIGTERLVARFNLKEIRTGISPDPQIRDGDVVMVGFSSSRGLVEDVLKAAPLFNTFVVLNRNL